METDFSRETTNPTIGIIGVGGFGARTASRMKRDFSCMEEVEVSLYAVDTDERTLPNHDTHLLSLHLPYLVHGTCDGHAVLGRIAALHYENTLFGHSSNDKESPGLLDLERNIITIVATGIGGGAGSGIAPVICERARTSSLTVAVACMPLDNTALKSDPRESLAQLRNSADIVFVVDPNLANFGIRNTSDTDRLAWAEEQTHQCITQLVTTIGTNGLIGLDLADVVDLFRNSQKSYYGYGIAPACTEDKEKALLASVKSAINQHHDLGLRSLRDNVTGGLVTFSIPRECTSFEAISTAARIIKSQFGKDKNFLFSAIPTEAVIGIRTDIWLVG
jgi:cell division protein FtsZ